MSAQLKALGLPWIVNTYFLRATALHPESGDVISVIEGPEPGPVALRIQRSGLVTTIGHALWLGRELERVRKQWGEPTA